MFEVVEGTMDPAAAPIEVAAGLRGQQMIVSARDQVADFFGIACGMAVLIKRLFHLPVIVAGAAQFVPSGWSPS